MRYVSCGHIEAATEQVSVRELPAHDVTIMDFSRVDPSYERESIHVSGTKAERVSFLRRLAEALTEAADRIDP